MTENTVNPYHLQPDEALIALIERYRQEVLEGIRTFKEQHSLAHFIAISGGSNAAEDEVIATLDDIFMGLQGLPVGIQTGGTQGGIPELALHRARAFGFKTIGVYPYEGTKYVLPDLLDLAVQEMPLSHGRASFGSETPTFVSMAAAGYIAAQLGYNTSYVQRRI